MITVFNPPEHLIEIAKYKYKRALVAVLVVVVALLFQVATGSTYLRYFSLLAFAYYLYLLMIYRIEKSVGITRDNQIVSPIHGKVISITEEEMGNLVVIKKNFFNFADIRFSADNDLLEPDNLSKEESNDLKQKELSLTNQNYDLHWKIKGNGIYYFPKSLRKKGVLTGIITGSGLCYYRLPKKYLITPRVGEKLEAGSSIIGEIE